MAALMIDAMQLWGAWTALSSDGMTPSAGLTIVGDAATETPSGDARSLVAQSAGPVLDHRLRRSIAPLDLAPWPELRLTWQANIATGSRADSPFFLELRLGSAAAPIGSPGNDWRRRLPLDRADRWESPRFSLIDLPPLVRAAVNQIELRCVANTPFVARLDALAAARASIPADIDAALLARLDAKISIAGVPVAAQIVAAGAPLPATLPLLLLQPYDLQPAWALDAAGVTPADFTGGGLRLRGASEAVTLDYAVEARAATRADQAALVDFLLDALPRQGTIAVNDAALRLEWVTAPVRDRAFAIERQLIHLRVTAWRERGVPVVVVPVKAITTTIDPRERAGG
ncbi:hypothetical protein [Sphingomonas sp. Leaf38]|uniref:hypothetical protein n=1 Tax=Sphingomonas sp. Leaf38 TaxID=1736217 RepID=UPI0006FD4B52|nr:hypothetical protein [Sphingomonas sp. Leaf38]KQN29388.1 hypothetical protein ASE88_10645 [Sphingomonas sp. Leaf38]